MRAALSLSIVVDNTNASTKRSRKWRKQRRAAEAAQRPEREALVLEAARALVSSAGADDWNEATVHARAICDLYNPDRDAPIAGVEVLLRSLVWVAEGSWSQTDDFRDASDLLLLSSLDDNGERRRVDDALWLLYMAIVEADPQPDVHAFRLFLCTVVDGMRWRLRPSAAPDGEGVTRASFRDAPTFVRRFAKELGGGPEAARLALRVPICFEHPGQTIIIPKQRRLNHPLAAIVLTDRAWAALYRTCLGGDGRPNVSALVAPSTGGSGRGALERARSAAAEWPEIFELSKARGKVAAEFKVAPRVARELAKDGIPF